jgi:hypothetical protein
MVSMVLGLIGYAVDSQVLITLLTSLAGAVSAGVTLYGAIKGDPSVEPSSFIPERMRCKPVQTGDFGSQQSGLPTGPFFDDR